VDFWTQDKMHSLLDYYGLERDYGSCLTIRSYQDASALRLCRIHRKEKPDG
jgi:hypothetical protein